MYKLAQLFITSIGFIAATATLAWVPMFLMDVAPFKCGIYSLGLVAFCGLLLGALDAKKKESDSPKS